MTNEMMDPSALPMPVITELLDSLNGSKVFSKLDQESGFHQFALVPEDRKKTAFTWKKTIHVSIGPIWFQELTARIFKSDFGSIRRYVFLSGLYGYRPFKQLQGALQSPSESHLSYQYNFKLGLKKCVLRRPEIIMLGHLISEEGKRNT
jgi:hypothetical protein